MTLQSGFDLQTFSLQPTDASQVNSSVVDVASNEAEFVMDIRTVLITPMSWAAHHCRNQVNVVQKTNAVMELASTLFNVAMVDQIVPVETMNMDVVSRELF